MFGTILRVLIVYLIVLVVIRLMGKRQIGQMQPFELVITLIIADLATIPMSERTIPLFSGIVPVLTLLLVHFIVSLITRKSIVLRKFINGKPVILVSPNGIIYKNLKQLNMNMDDLQELIRIAECQSLSEIQYAIVETNGNFSIIKKAENSPITISDLNLNKTETALNVILVSDFKIMKQNIEAFNLTISDVKQMIKQIGKNNFQIKDICYLSFDVGGNVYMQPKTGPCLMGVYKYKGELQI